MKGFTQLGPASTRPLTTVDDGEGGPPVMFVAHTTLLTEEKHRTGGWDPPGMVFDMKVNILLVGRIVDV